jgi:ABC-2 type transport system ATP-binding protein
MDDQPAIIIDRVSKSFVLPQEKTTSIKSAFINFGRRKRTYNTLQALKDVSFEIKKGDFFAIVGRNGSGKSTLLKMLAGIYVPNNGSITVNGTLTPFIELGVGFNPELTGRENVFLNGALLGFSRKEMSKMYHDIVDFAELTPFMDQKLKNYSSGMQVRLAFSLAIRAHADILLIDEVLAVGDADFQRKSLNYFKQLKKEKKTVVFVSHDMGAVKEFCDRGILIEDGVIKASGTADKIARDYSLMFESERGVPKNYSSQKPDERPGSGAARIEDVKTSVDDKEVVVEVKASALSNVDELIYGIHITGTDGVEITAMNNRMINVADIKDIKSGDEIGFSWKIQNIFSSGEYSITLTLADGELSTLDYFADAAIFKSHKKAKSNTSVLPPVNVKHSIESK